MKRPMYTVCAAVVAAGVAAGNCLADNSNAVPARVKMTARAESVAYEAPAVLPMEKTDAEVLYEAWAAAWLDAFVSGVSRETAVISPLEASFPPSVYKYAVKWNTDRDMLFPELGRHVPAYDSYFGYKDRQIKALCEAGDFAAAAEEARRFVEMWKSPVYLTAPPRRGGR